MSATIEKLLTAPDAIADEALSASEWARLLDVIRPDGFTVQAFSKEGLADSGTKRNAAGQLVRVYAFATLPQRWREELGAAKRSEGVALCRDLLDIAERAAAWVPPKPWGELPAATREKAMGVREVMVAYYEWLGQGLPKRTANLNAQALWLKIFEKSTNEKTIRRWETRLEERGAKYTPIANLRKEAFCDGKSCEHRAARKQHPEEFTKWFASRFLDSRSGVPTLSAVYETCQRMWLTGDAIPGLGIRSEHESFPYTKAQLRQFMPPRVVRELAGRGAFQAKTGKYLAAPPLDWTDVDPMAVVMFDDKKLDIQVLTDDGTRSFCPVVYIAYCAGTRRVLAYIVREDGHTRALDVEGLMAAVISTNGVGGPETGWPSTFVVERGTLAINDARKQFLEMMLAGRVKIQRTDMIGGKNYGGDFAQAASGNFFGKGVIEALMWAIDVYGKQLPGATGHRYDRQPAMLGDTTLTLEKLINSAKAGHRASRTLLDESITTAALARLLDWIDTGEAATARKASQRTGIKPPTLFYTDFVALLGEVFRAHNHRRGHRMQGFATVRVPHPDPEIAAAGRVLEVTESPVEKAARMFDTMAAAGRRLMRPDDSDVMALLHKVKRVTVRANGVETDGRRYWCHESRAMAEAVAIQGAAKEYLALYNPVDPSALYLLTNPPSHLPRKATEIPADGSFAPRLLEVLPLYRAPSIVDAEGMARRAAHVAAFNSRAARQLVVQAAPILLERTQEREALKDRIEPLRTAIDQSVALRTAAPTHAPGTLPPSALAADLAGAEAVTNEASTREDQRDDALPSFAARLAARQKQRQETQNE